MPAKSHYYRLQKGYTFPVVATVAREHRERRLAKLRLEATPVMLGGDCRCDSPGHSAQFGTYVLMDLASNTILNHQLVSVGGFAMCY